MPDPTFKQLLAEKVFNFLQNDLELLQDLASDLTDESWEVTKITSTHFQIRYKRGENTIPRYYNVRISEAL